MTERERLIKEIEQLKKRLHEIDGKQPLVPFGAEQLTKIPIWRKDIHGRSFVSPRIAVLSEVVREYCIPRRVKHTTGFDRILRPQEMTEVEYAKYSEAFTKILQVLNDYYEGKEEEL